jgi:excisionase family DNA binding protein
MPRSPRTNRATRTADPACLLLTVEQAAYRLGIGRSTAYQLISTGQLTSIRIGHLRRVPVDALAAFVESMKNGAQVADGPFGTTVAARG